MAPSQEFEEESKLEYKLNVIHINRKLFLQKYSKLTELNV